MSIDTCVSCDRGDHDACDGTVRVVDQDGHSRYTCRCYHRYKVLEAQRIEHAESRVRSLMREVDIDMTHELVRRP